MKKMKKVAALAMATAMAVSMAACGGSSATSTASTAAGDTKADSGSYDQVVYAYATFNNIPSEELKKKSTKLQERKSTRKSR